MTERSTRRCAAFAHAYEMHVHAKARATDTLSAKLLHARTCSRIETSNRCGRSTIWHSSHSLGHYGQRKRRAFGATQWRSVRACQTECARFSPMRRGLRHPSIRS
eukprot:6148780-Pleurochrysis_carterae.AAC.1